MDVAVGRVVYTSLLDERGGFKSDLTIMRLGPQHFRVVTGGATGMAEKKWFLDHLPENGSAQLADLTSAWTTFGLWGPRARDVLQSCTDDDVSNDGFAFGTCRQLELGGLRVLASRISYVGELGWELYVPIEEGARAWNTLWEAGREHGIVPVGIGVYGTTGRLEKGYRAFGNELTADYDIVEAGMARPSVKKDWFVGKEPYLRQRETEPVARLCTLTVDDHRSASGPLRYMLGGEPILTAEGDRLEDEKGRPSYVTSAGSGPSVGKHLLLAYLPAAAAQQGAGLLGGVPERVLSRHRRRRRIDPSVRSRQRPGQKLNEVNVLVCIKRVPMVGGRIAVTPDAQEVDTRLLGFTVSPHEECAVEEAVRIVENRGGSVSVLTLGPEEAAEQLRDAVAIGAGKPILLATDGREWGPIATADAIVDTIRRHEADDEAYDLILFGNEAADTGDYQVGVRVAHALGRPCVTGVKHLEVSDTTVRARREFRGGDELFELRLPSVVTRQGRDQSSPLPVLARPDASKEGGRRASRPGVARGPRTERGAPGPGRRAPAGRDPRDGSRGRAGTARVARAAGVSSRDRPVSRRT